MIERSLEVKLPTIWADEKQKSKNLFYHHCLSDEFFSLKPYLAISGVVEAESTENTENTESIGCVSWSKSPVKERPKKRW